MSSPDKAYDVLYGEQLESCIEQYRTNPRRRRDVDKVATAEGLHPTVVLMRLAGDLVAADLAGAVSDEETIAFAAKRHGKDPEQFARRTKLRRAIWGED